MNAPFTLSGDEAILSVGEKFTLAQERLVAARAKYNPCAVVALYSTGGDSSASTAIATETFSDCEVAFINTGTAIPEVIEHAYREAAANRWRFREMRAAENRNARGELDPQNYEALVMRYGFPGAYGHGMMYQRLKERQIQALERMYGATKERPLMLISGVRSEESKRRMGKTKPEQHVGRRVWIAGIHDFTKADCSACSLKCGLRQSIVSAHLGRSGECNCGAFAGSGGKGELDGIAHWFPTFGKWLRDLEKRVMQKFPRGWEDDVPEWHLESKRGQEMLFDMRKEEMPASDLIMCACFKKEHPAEDQITPRTEEIPDTTAK